MLYLDELIEHVVQDVAMDGCLGADSDYLREFIKCTIPTLPSSSSRSVEPLIDDAFVAYFWRVLVAIPCIEVILLDRPLIATSGTPGLVNQPPAERTAKQKAKLAKSFNGKLDKGQAPVAELSSKEPITVLQQDDGSEARIPKSDLRKLLAAHGNLIRVRVDAEERYHALTGTYARIGAMSVLSLRALQLIGKSRAKGITGQDLTVLLGIDAKSMHHYVKILIQNKLVEKFPVQQGGVRTNRVVHRRYLHQNDDYLAWNPSIAETASAPPASQPVDDDSDSGDNEQQRKQRKFITERHRYPPMTFAQLGSGVLFKKRLVEILDSGLHNNTLRSKHLFELTGFQGQNTVAERRLRRRHIQGLIREGVIEQFQVLSNHHGGDKQILVYCLRLTKYNPHRLGLASKIQEIPGEASDDDMDEVDETSLPPYNPRIGVSATRTIEFSIVEAICSAPEQAGVVSGYSLSELPGKVGGLASRTAEYLIQRMEELPSIPHLSDKSVAVITETVGRQRKLRVINIDAYHRWCNTHNIAIDLTRYPPPNPSAGGFTDLSHRKTYTTAAQYNRFVSAGEVLKGKNQSSYDGPPRKRGRPRKHPLTEEEEKKKQEKSDYDGPPRKRGRPRKQPLPEEKEVDEQEEDNEEEEEQEEDDEDESAAVSAVSAFETQNQDGGKRPQGRPRKGVFIFQQGSNVRKRDNKRRMIPIRPGHPENFIYIKEGKIIVPAPDGYEGYGKPPKVTKAMLAKAREISDFYDNPYGDGPEELNDLEAEVPMRKKAKKGRSKAADEDHSSEEPPAEAADLPTKWKSVKAPEINVNKRKHRDEDLPAVEEPRPQRPKRKTRKDVVPDSLPWQPSTPLVDDPPQEVSPASEPVDEAKAAAPPDKQGLSRQASPVPDVPAETLPDIPPVNLYLTPSSAASAKSFSAAAHTASSPSLPTPRPSNGRMSITDFVKTNEILQSLRDDGGVCLRTDLRNIHHAWTVTNAGKPGIFCPPAPVQFDRNTAERLVNRLLDAKSIHEKKVFVATGRSSTPLATIIYIDGTPNEDIARFTARLDFGVGHKNIQVARGPNGPLPVSSGGFAEASIPAELRESRARETLRKAKDLGLSQDDLQIREEIMKERYVVAQRYGWKIGVAARAKVLHQEIMRIIKANPADVVSASHGIFVMPVLFQEMTARAFMSIIPSSLYSSELLDILAASENRDLLIKDLDPALRPRKKTYDLQHMGNLISILVELGLVTPLQAAALEDAQISTQHSGPFAKHFCIEQTHGRPQRTSAYYRLNSVVPVYHLARADSPLIGSFVIETLQDSQELWALLRSACQVVDKLEPPAALQLHPAAHVSTWPGEDGTRLLMLKSGSYIDDYRPNETQRTVLRDTIDWAKGVRKVKNAQEFNALCFKLFMKPPVVAEYLVNLEFAAKEKLRRHAEAVKPMRRMLQATASAHKKVDSHKAESLLQWQTAFKEKAQELAISMSDELLVKLAYHRDAFVAQARKLSETEVELELRKAMTGVEPRASRAINKGPPAIAPRPAMPSAPAQSDPSAASDPAPVPATPQLPPLAMHENPALRVFAKAKSDSAKATRNRHTFSDEDYELLLDAEAVVRSRGRNITAGHRGHGAILELFVGWRAPSLHNVLKRHRSDPAIMGYYVRLEDAWHQIFMQNRGEFDINYHVNFLRKYVNKAALRVEAPTAGHNAARAVVSLPSTVHDLLRAFQVEPPVGRDNVEDYWRAYSDEQKLGSLARAPFTTTAPGNSGRKTEIEAGVIDALLKMIIATPEQAYDAEAANRLLSPYTSHVYEAEIQRLVDRGVFSRKAGRRSESRKFGFSATWVNNAIGPYPENVHHAAESLEYSLAASTSRTVWPVVGNDGQLAALLTLVSCAAVDIDVDIKSCTVLRRPIDDHGTRSIVDADTEATLHIILVAPPLSPLFATMSLALASTDPDVQTLADLVHKAGSKGLTKPEIMTALPEWDVQTLTAAAQAPVLNWVGYETARLVHEDFMADWLVIVYPRASPNEPVMISPRRWVDLWGEMMELEWQKAVRLAVGHILSRPGQTERHLRNTLLPFLDRLETNAVLSHLVSNKIACRAVIKAEHRALLSPVEQTDVAEEDFIYYTMNPQTLWRRGEDDDLDNE